MNLKETFDQTRRALILAEHIEKKGSEYELVAQDGKDLGKYGSKAGAEERERQVEYFKHAKESEDCPYTKLGKLTEQILARTRK